jgi:CRISPR type I-E-associated protein CasB/Cse2
MTEKNTLFDLSGLDKEAKILFRRSIGKPLNSVMSRTAHYYYAAESSFGKILNEDLHFAILCLACMYEDDHGKPCHTEYVLHQAIASAKSNGNSTSLEHRIDNLLATDPERNPYEFIAKLYRILKLADISSYHIVPDWDALYEDLCKWNVSGSATAKNVKRKWIKSIYF